MIKLFWKEGGFTLIEILVIAAMIIFLTTVTFFSNQQGREIFLLEREAQKVAQDIRRTQEMAISTVGCEGCDSGSFGIPSGGYGVYFDKNSSLNYIIYADTHPPPGGDSKYVGGDKEIETVYLEEGVSISGIGPGNKTRTSINFEPPDPIINIDAQGSPDSVEIYISLDSDPSRTRTISVNKAGLIDIK